MYSPVDYFTGAAHNANITSPYGRRTHPITKEPGTMHWGIDFTIRPRDGIYTTPYACEVTRTASHGGRGRTVVARILGTNILMLFQHASEYLCKVGDLLQVGDPVIKQGRTGDSTGEHLHFELRIDNGTALGSPVWGDPADFQWGGGSMRRTYAVVRGDTLAAIARRFGVTVQELREWNGRTPAEDRSLAIGTVLFVEPDWRQLAKDLQEQVAQCKRERQQLAKDNTELSDKVHQLADANTDLKATTQQQGAVIAELETAIKTKRAELRQKTDIISTLEQQADALEAALTDKSIKLDAQALAVEELTAAADNNAREAADLALELDNSMEARAKKAQQIADLREQLGQTQRLLSKDLTWTQLLGMALDKLVRETMARILQKRKGE